MTKRSGLGQLARFRTKLIFENRPGWLSSLNREVSIMQRR